jgi:hypothetical protein
VAKLKPEFEKRKVKCIGLSIDPVESHKGWAEDIKETQGAALNFPIIADPQRKVADLYGMMHPKPSPLLRNVFGAPVHVGRVELQQTLAVEPRELVDPCPGQDGDR